jgi:hypothetical protein
MIIEHDIHWLDNIEHKKIMYENEIKYLVKIRFDTKSTSIIRIKSVNYLHKSSY